MKLPFFAIITLVFGIGFCILAPVPPFALEHPVEFGDRHDAQITEAMAGINPMVQEVPTQHHRVLTAWLLRILPGTPKQRWCYIWWGSLLIIGVCWWKIGRHLSGGSWEYGALGAAVGLSIMGWQLGLLPWHKDTVVAGLESVVILFFVKRSWFGLAIALAVGMLAKETLFFLAIAVFMGLLGEIILARRGENK